VNPNQKQKKRKRLFRMRMRISTKVRKVRVITLMTSLSGMQDLTLSLIVMSKKVSMMRLQRDPLIQKL
jgi:hypothetical protein